MSLTKRDKAILSDLNRFRVMDRDSIAELHFAGLKNPRFAANNVLLRLVREGHIKRSTAFVPYVYFGGDVNMKQNSAKIGHFLAILDVYKEMMRSGGCAMFLTEPKYGRKGTVEPDIFCIFRKKPMFIEVQRTIYSEKKMAEKLARYEALYNSGIIAQEPWQPANKTVTPHVLIITEQRYAIEPRYPFKVFQTPSFAEFVRSLAVSDPAPVKPASAPKMRSSNGTLTLNVK
ncbi:hypothetical protein AB685_00395 [Bacillus sp. LL01]|uniref:hypothetical protein n=1 Tax=Bacillus sp. LL01 TaxID=1665556 RepID=UPI00064CF699|nr:hypothetical protein [Bacillus sp. LL01]KMJ59386.1 hypothetical protein AB685_00395 [Bacillus sp. LL01]